MNIVEIIEKKKCGLELNETEINFFVNGYVDGSVMDYQASALLMAILLKGMNAMETSLLTKAMINSGDTIDLSSISGVKVDKHSTGGVGDKTSIALLPLLAACGCKCAKMSGRGLGFTGGTLDKLESIPDFNVSLTNEQFLKQVNEIGLAIIGQTGNLVPADKKMYALRDVTATVDCLPLIASSIMSKKLAAGSDTILLDVKYGKGAFMKDVEDAKVLAKAMTEIGIAAGKDTKAVLSPMNQPLGLAIGNTVEIIEAIKTLKGEGPEDFLELLLESGEIILQQANIASDADSARKMLLDSIKSGAALNKLREMISYQGGNQEVCNDYTLMPTAKYVTAVDGLNGYLKEIDTLDLAFFVNSLGGGRERKEDEIDHAVGLVLNCKIGDKLDGIPICYIHHNKLLSDEEISDLKNAFITTDEVVKKLEGSHSLV